MLREGVQVLGDLPLAIDPDEVLRFQGYKKGVDVPTADVRALLDEALAAGADIVGMNCGRGPDRAIVIIREMRQVTDAPLVAYPNAGLPITTGDTVTYELGPEAMAREYPALLDAGVNIVGACCGSNPEHIRLIAQAVRSHKR